MSRPLAVAVVRGLDRAGLTVALAESLTGGLVSAALTDVPGSSAVVRGGVVAYPVDVKARLLDVDDALLAAGGAVQGEVAAQMALGCAALLGADCGVGTTGVAGPGPADGHPAGTVHVAVSLAGTVRTRRLRLAGTRGLVRRASVDSALALLLGMLADHRRG